jgi:dTDP-4-dehydrorhamnose 3,5-epimerase
MDRIEMSLPGVIELRPTVFRDEHGFFPVTYHETKFAQLGIKDRFVQDNHSSPSRGTMRGLHYQLLHPQAKLCRVVDGEALDIALDIRFGSPHFGKWTSVQLTAKQQNQLYVPRGLAHGFLALTDKVQFLYKCSGFYNPGDEHGILWSDLDLNISWGIREAIVSEKDTRSPRLAQVAQEFLPRYAGK